MIVLIDELIVTVVNGAIAVPVTVVHVVGIILHGPVTIRVPGRWPEDPVRVDVVRKRSVSVAIPVVRTIPASRVIIRISVRNMVVALVSCRSVPIRAVIKTSVVSRPDRPIRRRWPWRRVASTVGRPHRWVVAWTNRACWASDNWSTGNGTVRASAWS